MNTFSHFLQYHNAVPIALGILFLGAGATFAATNPETIYSAEQQVISIDNTYLANKDLSNWTPQIRIEGVTEDDENYHVAYTLSTIDLDGYAWKDVAKNETMSVSKADLGQYRDLGVYVTQQLRQIIDRDLQRLRQTQEIEKSNVSLAVVATAYGGLVGQMLNDTTEVLPGYTPVVQGPPEAPGQVAAAAASDPASPTGSAQSGGALAVGSVLSGDPSDTEPPFLQILGSASLTLQEGGYYIDLGAVAADNGKADLVEVTLYLNGTKVERVYMPDAKVGEWIVTYEARDKAGNITRAQRHITVLARAPVPAPAPDSTSAPQAEPAPATSTSTTPTPEPAPATTTPETASTPEAAPATSTPESTVQPEPTPAAAPEPPPAPPVETPVTS